jgi:thiol-disulfide isomerase/thioredoxin
MIKRLRKLFYFLLIFTGASLVANAWITRDHVTGAAPPLPLDQRIHYRNDADRPTTGSAQNAPTLVYFYASWCPICKVDLPAVESLAGSYPVVAVAMQSGNDAEVLAHRIEQDFDLDIINDETGELSRAFGVRGVPTAFVVEDDSNIRFSTQGFSGWIGYWSRMLLADWF